jgi:phosphate ABC transporter permease protein PstC
MNKNLKEQLIKAILFVCAASSIGVVLLIMGAITYGGYPRIIDWLEHGFGMQFLPTVKQYGIIPLIFSTFYLGVGATAVGGILGLPCAIYLAEFADMRLRNMLKPSLEILSGFPSVVIGLVGFYVVANTLRNLTGSGVSMLAAWIVVGVMALPTIASISEDAIRAVPHDLKEASLAVGATRWQTMRHVLLPAAKSGILTSLILAMGAAVGETMAVLMVIGGVANPPITLDPLVRSTVMTTEIVQYWGYGSSNTEILQSFFALGFILFLIVGVLNLIIRRAVKQKGFPR